MPACTSACNRSARMPLMPETRSDAGAAARARTRARRKQSRSKPLRSNDSDSEIQEITGADQVTGSKFRHSPPLGGTSDTRQIPSEQGIFRDLTGKFRSAILGRSMQLGASVP